MTFKTENNAKEQRKSKEIPERQGACSLAGGLPGAVLVWWMLLLPPGAL